MYRYIKSSTQQTDYNDLPESFDDFREDGTYGYSFTNGMYKVYITPVESDDGVLYAYQIYKDTNYGTDRAPRYGLCWLSKNLMTFDECLDHMKSDFEKYRFA